MRRTIVVGLVLLGASAVVPAARAAVRCDEVAGVATFCRGSETDGTNTVNIIDVKVTPVKGQVHFGQVSNGSRTWSGAGVCALGVTCAGPPVTDQLPLLPPFPV